MTLLIRTLHVLDDPYASRSGALLFRQFCNAAWSIAQHLEHHRSHSSSYSSSSIISSIGQQRKELISGRRYQVPGLGGTTTTATTTTWDLRGEGIADLGVSTIKGTGRIEGDNAYDYIDDALMLTIDVILDCIALRVVEFLEGGGTGWGWRRGNDRPILLLLLCHPPDVDVIHYGDDHDNRDDVDAAGRTINAPVGVRDRQSSRSSAGMGGTPQDRATVDANVDNLAVVAFVVLYVVL